MLLGMPAPAATWSARRLLATVPVALALAGAGLWIGEHYISRLPDHRGYHLVAVDDAVRPPLPERPRHTVVVLADGLGHDFARGMRSTARLQSAGQCRATDVGPISVSRPVYAVLSTGLEQDRTGARNNDERSPLAAESIWEIARDAGLEVAGVSDVPWWQELFPRGFSRYAVLPDRENFFALAPLVDLDLIHPTSTDHAGHAHGAASPEYAAAVARLDAEFGALLDRLDLERDLVVFTADHGHAATGGHGGPSPEISRVLTCFAGRGVARTGVGEPIHTHAIAGTLAVLLGLRFPRHMRAVEDDLDAIFAIADPDAFPPGYLDDRRAAIEAFRAANRSRLAAWLGRPGGWQDLYDLGRRRQLLRALAVFAGLGAGFLVLARRRRLGARGALALAGWCASVLAIAAALHVIVLGSLDWTAINLRERYLRAAPLICLAPALVLLPLRAWRLRDGPRLVGDQLTLAALALGLDLGHIAVYAWPLGFPLPSPAMLLFPFLASIFVVVHALLAVLLAGVVLVRRPR